MENSRLDRATIADLKVQVETIRELLAAEPAALDRDRLQAMADEIDATLLAATTRGGQDVGE